MAQSRRALAYVLAGKMAVCGTLDIKEHNGQVTNHLTRLLTANIYSLKHVLICTICTQTALQIAVATNQHLIVHDLLVHGAQINILDFWGRSPLHVCAEKGHFLSLQVTRHC